MNQNHPYSHSNTYQQQQYDSFNHDEPPSSSFFASQHEQSNSGGNGAGYRYAAYEDDYLYDDSYNLQHETVIDDNDIHRNMGLPPESGHANVYGENTNRYHVANDNLSSASSSSNTSSASSSSSNGNSQSVNFDDPAIADLPRILLMGPRRSGKTSIQRVVFQKMSPHETLFRLEATQEFDRFLVDHTPLCRFTIWDFAGDFYGQQHQHQIMHQYSTQQQQELHGHQHPQHQMPQSNYTSQHYYYQQQQQGYYQNPPDNNAYNMYGHYSNLHPSYSTTGGPPGIIIAPNFSNNNANNNTTANNDLKNMNVNNNDQNNLFSDANIYTQATALIFVIDAQDEPYDHVLQSFTETVTRAISANPHVAIEVFINKVDGELFITDEAKYDCHRDIMQQVSEELHDAGINENNVPVSYHLTSIYDHSIFEAFSRVVQKLIPQYPTLENLLNVLVSTCSMEKAYLFDVATKLYISKDSSPVDMQSVELCSDMIDVVLDVSGIYGLRQQHPSQETERNKEKKQQKLLEHEGKNLPSNIQDSASTSIDENGHGNVVGDNLELSSTKNIEDMSNKDDVNEEAGMSNNNYDNADDDEEAELISDSAYDSESSSVIRLSTGMVLFLKEVDTMLALVCITTAENFRKKSLINYNISCLKKALRMLIQPRLTAHSQSAPPS